VSFKMSCWRHWRLVWAQMRSFRDPERLLDDLLEVMRGSCSAGAWPGWLAGRPKAEDTCPGGGILPVPGPYQQVDQIAASYKLQEIILQDCKHCMDYKAARLQGGRGYMQLAARLCLAAWWPTRGRRICTAQKTDKRARGQLS